MIKASVPEFTSQTPNVIGRILAMANCQNESLLISEFESIVNIIGFDRYHYAGSFPTPIGTRTRRMISNHRATGIDSACHAMGNLTSIIQAAQLSTAPIIFELNRHVYPLQATIHWNTTDKDIGDGIVFPIHTAHGNAGVLVFFVGINQKSSRTTILSSLGEASLASIYFHDALNRIILKSDSQIKIALSSNEKECLFWIARHKSNWDISRILGVSEHTIVYYVRRLMRKLNAQNRHEAVERAKEFSLI